MKKFVVSFLFLFIWNCQSNQVEISNSSPSDEKQNHVEGTLQVSVMDDFEHQKSTTTNVVHTKDGRDIPLDLDGVENTSQLISGSLISLSGNMSNEIFRASSLNTSIGILPPDVGGGGTGVASEMKIAVALLYYRDRAPGNPPAISKPNVANTLFGTQGNSVNLFYKEASYNAVGITGSSSDIFGWYRIDDQDPKCPGEIQSAWVQRVLQAADADIDFNKGYTHLAIVAPNPAGCTVGGVATYGKITYSTQEGPKTLGIIMIPPQNGTSAFVLAHELGHTFGTMHARLRKYAHSHPASVSDAPISVGEYGDRYSVMGGGELWPYTSAVPHFSAIEKEKFGWLRSNQIKETLSSGTYNISTMSRPLGGIPKALLLNKLNRSEIYIEYRQPYGFDSPLAANGENVFSGVLIRAKDNTGTNIFSHIATPQNPADEFQMAMNDWYIDSRGDLISKGTQTSASVSVQITLAKDFVRFLSPVSNSTIFGNVPLQISLPRPDLISRLELFVDRDPFTQPSAVSFFQIDSPGASVSSTLNTTPLYNGPHYISFRMTDIRGNVSTNIDILRFSILNPNAPPPFVTITQPATSGGFFGRNNLSVIASTTSGVTIQQVDFYTQCTQELDGTTSTLCNPNAPLFLCNTVFVPPYECSPNNGLERHSAIYNLYAKATDSVGNVSMSTPVYVTRDLSPPTASFVSPSTNANFSSPLFVKLDVSDDLSVVDRVYLTIRNQGCPQVPCTVFIQPPMLTSAPFETYVNLGAAVGDLEVVAYVFDSSGTGMTIPPTLFHVQEGSGSSGNFFYPVGD